MKRIIRDRRLTSEEAANYQVVREQIAGDARPVGAAPPAAWPPSTNWLNCSSN